MVPQKSSLAAVTPAIAALLAACSSAPTAPVTVKQGPPELVVSRPTCEPVAKPTLAKVSWDARARAVHDLVTGRAGLAAEGLAKVLDERPGDIGAYALRAAAQNAMAREAERGNAERSRMKPVQIPGDVGGKPHAFAPTRASKLVVLDVESPEDWFAQHGFSEPYQLDEAAGSAMPIGELSISRQIRFDDHGILVFGNSLVVVSPASGSPARGFDLHNLAPQGSSVQFAQVVDRVLVALFAEDAGSRLVAIDVDEKRAIWSTERLAMASESFAVSGTLAFVGASVGAAEGEPVGVVATVDLATGEIVDRVRLDLLPRWVFAKDGAVLVVDGAQGAAAKLGVEDLSLPAAVASGLSSEAPAVVDDASVRECQYGRSSRPTNRPRARSSARRSSSATRSCRPTRRPISLPRPRSRSSDPRRRRSRRCRRASSGRRRS